MDDVVPGPAGQMLTNPDEGESGSKSFPLLPSLGSHDAYRKPVNPGGTDLSRGERLPETLQPSTFLGVLRPSQPNGPSQKTTNHRRRDQLRIFSEGETGLLRLEVGKWAKWTV